MIDQPVILPDSAAPPEHTGLVIGQHPPIALSQAAAAADRAAAAAIFSAYREQLAPHTRSAHDQDFARCELYLADVGVAVGALASEPAAWSGFTWASSKASSAGCCAGATLWRRSTAPW